MQIEIKLPEDLEEGGSILDVFVNVGDLVELEQGLIEIETDKATVEVPSTHAGKVLEIKVQEGDDLEAGGIILLLETTAAAAVSEPHAAAPAPESDPEPVVEKPAPAAEAPKPPADPPAPTPVATTERTPVPASTPTPSTEILGDLSSDKWGPVRFQKMTRIRRTIASKMDESWSTVPRVTNFDDADVTSLEAMRQTSKADYTESGVKLTAMPFVIKSCALALKSNPLVNAAIDIANERIIFKDYVNVGIAVDTDRGLVVPSLRNADQLSISSIDRALGEIANKARSATFSVDDLRGSTFTISNLGAIGGTYSTPIINTPEVAVLLVGRSRKLPVVVNDEIVIRLMMPLSLSYDHRLVDGAAAARFMNDVIAFLSTPSRLLIAP